MVGQSNVHLHNDKTNFQYDDNQKFMKKYAFCGRGSSPSPPGHDGGLTAPPPPDGKVRVVDNSTPGKKNRPLNTKRIKRFGTKKRLKKNDFFFYIQSVTHPVLFHFTPNKN